MPSKIDKRHKEIGGRHRALSRYHMIVHRVENAHLPRNSGYKGILVLVSKDEFIEWFMPRDFPGCSVDRIDNKGHYQLSNMQVIPLTRLSLDRLDECPEVPEEYHLPMLDWAAYLALSNHDADAESLNRASLRQQSFERTIAQSILDTRRRRRPAAAWRFNVDYAR